MFGAKIKFKHRDVDKLTHHCVEIEEWFSYEEKFQDTSNIEVTLGGDHGKGSYTLLLSIVVRFRDYDKEPDMLNLECGRIEYHQDKLELLKILVNKLLPSLRRITSGTGAERFIITSANSMSKKFKFYTNTNNVIYFNDMIMHMNVKMTLHLNGEIKGLMQFLGRSAFDSHYCMCCKIGSRTKMSKYHYETCIDTTEENRHEWWTIQDLKETAFSQSQSDINENQQESVGVLEQPLLDMIPICNIVPSLLHLTLGIGNKIMSSFFTYCYERFETLTSSEVEAETLSILAELDFNNKT